MSKENRRVSQAKTVLLKASLVWPPKQPPGQTKLRDGQDNATDPYYPDGPKANHVLTINMDHSSGAAQSEKLEP